LFDSELEGMYHLPGNLWVETPGMAQPLSRAIKKLIILVILLAMLAVSFFYLRRLNPWFLFDFIEYWSAGSLLLAHQNPYDPVALLAVQKTVGWTPAEALMMWNPPWIAPLIIPLAFFDYFSSRTLWFFLQIAVLAYCATLLWRLYAGDRRSGRLVTIIAGILTGSVFWMLFYGQISFLILLGVTGFLALIQRRTFKSDFFAGAFAVLIAIKPQVLYLFWPALFLWTLSSRRWGALLGCLSAVCLSLLIGSAFYPNLLAGYISSLQTMPLTVWYTPTIGFWLRVWLGFEHFWLQFLPLLPALVWLLIYFWRKRQDWHWLSEMPLLILVSIATSAYTWTHDQVVFLVPLVFLAVAFQVARHKQAMVIFGGIWLVLNFLLLISHFFVQDHYLAWLAPLLLIIYLIARWLIDRPAALNRQGTSLPAT